SGGRRGNGGADPRDGGDGRPARARDRRARRRPPAPARRDRTRRRRGEQALPPDRVVRVDQDPRGARLSAGAPPRAARGAGRMRYLAIAILLAACGSKLEASPERTVKLVPITDTLCVTKGAAKVGATVNEPTMRAVAPGTSGDGASFDFTYRGDTATSRE